MPANKKHLTRSPLHRFLKVSAGFVGGYAVTEALHMALMPYVGSANALFTLRWAGFIVWATLMALAFIPRNGWKIWGLYLAITAVLVAIIYLNNG